MSRRGRPRGRAARAVSPRTLEHACHGPRLHGDRARTPAAPRVARALRQPHLGRRRRPPSLTTKRARQRRLQLGPEPADQGRRDQASRGDLRPLPHLARALQHAREEVGASASRELSLRGCQVPGAARYQLQRILPNLWFVLLKVAPHARLSEQGGVLRKGTCKSGKGSFASDARGGPRRNEAAAASCATLCHDNASKGINVLLHWAAKHPC
jgi:hypothetical protein